MNCDLKNNLLEAVSFYKTSGKISQFVGIANYVKDT